VFDSLKTKLCGLIEQGMKIDGVQIRAGEDWEC
jgi:hypothetical protein